MLGLPLSIPLLSARQITRVDPASGRKLLDGVSLDIPSAQRIGLLGPSGSGKSLLMRACVMLDTLESGEIRWQGQRVAPADVPRFRRQAIYLPQQIAVADITAETFLRFPYTLGGYRDERFDERQVSQWINDCGCDAPSILGSPMNQLSGGQRQLVALVRGLQLHPTLLLLDEATSAMDAQLSEAAERLVLQWFDQNPERGLVWITHQAELVQRIATHTVTLRQGRCL